MKSLRIVIITFILFVSFISCNKKETNENTGANHPHQIEISGVLEKLEVTTFQYGTHYLSGYALISKTIELDSFVNKNVSVIGTLIDGYPMDGGPEFIEVIEVK